MKLVLLLFIAFATLFAGCSKSTRMLEIREPPDVPFDVTWVKQHPDLQEIFFINQTVGWAAGRGGDVLFTQDGGETWKPRARLPDKALDGIYFLDKSNGWLATTDGEVLATTDGGVTWTLSRKAIYKHKDVRHIKFVDKNIGWVVSARSLQATTDRGSTWTEYYFPDTFVCFDAHFVDAQHGWAVGNHGRVLATRNGGKSWTSQNSGVSLPLRSVFFLDEKTGWAATSNHILWTVDGGETWNLPTSEMQGHIAQYESKGSLQFIDAQTGWAIGKDDVILRTTDGGKTWLAVGQAPRRRHGSSFKTLYFVSASKGWAAGDSGAIFTSDDGGKTWRRQNKIKPPEAYAADPSRILTGKPYDSSARAEVTVAHAQIDTRYHITRYLFANASTGWAIGSFMAEAGSDPVGVLFSTTDGGKTWSLQSLDSYEPSSLHLVDNKVVLVYAKHFFDNMQALFWGTATYRAPSLKWFRADETATGDIALQWQVRAKDPESVACTLLEFSQGTAQNFGPIDLAGLKKHEDGVFSRTIKAKDYGIGDGAEVHFRVTLNAAGLRYAHQVPEPFVYRPWWTRQSSLTKSVLGAAVVLALYYSISFALLLVFPLGSLWVQQRLPIDKVVDLVPNVGIRSVLNRLFDDIGPRYFSTRERVRKVWLRRFEANYATLTALSRSTQQVFLRHDDVCAAWLAHYMQGLCTFADLPGELQQDYVQRPACLDAWVERRVRKAVEAYGRLDSVRQRGIYIQLPVRVGELATGKYLNSPDSADFRALLDSPASVLAIIGEGGTGKSTLAFQLGRWALSDNVATRLASHRMIPVVIEEETGDLLATVRGVLTEMVGPDEFADDVVKSLLASKRLLVIVDGLSERTHDTQRHVASIHRHARVGALVVTSRKRLDFGATEVTEVWPEQVTNETIFYFVTEYLRRNGVAEHFLGRTALQLGERLISVVESSSQGKQIVPLFVTIFVDQAVALRRQNEPLEHLPVSLAEMVIEHLRRTNPQDPDVPNRVPTATLIRAVRVLGNCSLMPHFVPHNVFRDDAERALQEHGISIEGADIIQRLLENGVLEERDRGGTRIVRFVLDPIAEYTAALYRLDKLRDRQHDWEEWANEICSTEGYPKEMRGFLIALENCVSAYRNDLQIPVLPAKLQASQLAQETPASG